MRAEVALLLRDCLATRHAPKAPRVSASILPLARGARFVRLRDREQLFGFGQSGQVYFGCTGTDAPRIESLRIEPAALGELLEARVDCAAQLDRWSLMRVTLEPRADTREALLELLACDPQIVCRFDAPEVENASGFSLPIEVCLALVQIDPAVLDFGELDAVGCCSWPVSAAGSYLIESAGGAARYELEAGVTQLQLALPDGQYRLQDPAAGHQLRRLDRQRMEVLLHNRGRNPVRLKLAGCPAGMRVHPPLLRIEPQHTAQLSVSLDPARLGELGDVRRRISFARQVEYTLHGKPALAVTDALELELRATLTATTSALLLDRAPVTLGNRTARERRCTIRIPYQHYGEGRMSAELTFLDSTGEPLERAVFRQAEAQTTLIAPQHGCRQGAFEAEVDLPQLLLHGGQEFVALLRTDQACLNLREQRTRVRVEVSGRLLQTRAMQVTMIEGLPFRIPLAWRVRGAAPDFGPVLSKASGLPPGWADRLQSDDGRASALTARILRDPELEGDGGVLGTGLLLDLTGVTQEREYAGVWQLSLLDPDSGLSADVRLTVVVETREAFLQEIFFEPQGDRGELVFTVTNPLDRAIRIRGVGVRGQHIPGFTPLEFPYEATIEPGAIRRFRIPLLLPPRGALSWLRKLIGRARTLALSVQTDLPGNFCIQTTHPLD